MSRPLSDTIPDEIADIIRSNSEWGDLTRFAEKEGLKRSTVYSLILYKQNKKLLRLYALAEKLEVTTDRIYELLLIENIIERKARFQLLMSKVGIENFVVLADEAGINRGTFYRYINEKGISKLFRDCYQVSHKMGISLHEFASIFATKS